MQQWLNELQADLAETELLASQIPAADTDPAEHQSVMELDIRLVEILALSIRANRLADKYRLSLSADAADTERRTLLDAVIADISVAGAPAP